MRRPKARTKTEMSAVQRHHAFMRLGMNRPWLEAAFKTIRERLNQDWSPDKPKAKRTKA